MISTDNDRNEACGSILGTKEYWEDAYENDLENYESTNDSGEIWFGRSCQDRIIKWLNNRLEIDRTKCRLLDFGCGNGALSIALREIGYARVAGIDYALSAVALARRVADGKGFFDVSFEVCDILADSFDTKLLNNFDVLLDKGTFDAIGLMQNGLESRRKYKANVIKFLDPQSPDRFLILASCNSTKDELVEFFSPEFHLVDEIVATNNFVFGGRKGSAVTTVVLRSPEPGSS